MVPALMRAFDVGALALGSLSAYFYYPYVLMQIPVGSVVDRFSVRWILMSMAILCGFFSILFGYAQALWLAQLCRLLMGFSASFAFVGTLKLATLWFDSRHLGLLAGLTQGLGMLGAAVGEGPVAILVAHLGWRQAMAIMGGVLVLIGFAIGFLLKDKSPEAETALASTPLSRGPAGLVQDLRQILKNPMTSINALYAGLMYGPTVLFAELWGVEYLVHVHGLTHRMAAAGISLIFIGWAMGGPLVGWISDRLQQRRSVMWVSSVACLLTMLAILYLSMPWAVLFILLFAYGVANTGVGVSYAMSGEINPPEVTGVCIGFTNMASVLLGTMMQPMVGWILERGWNGLKLNGVPLYSVQTYHQAMLVIPIAFALSIGVVFWMRAEAH